MGLVIALLANIVIQLGFSYFTGQVMGFLATIIIAFSLGAASAIYDDRNA